MPTITVNAKSVKRQLDNITIADVIITLLNNPNKSIKSVVNFDKINTPYKFANWLMFQDFPPIQSSPEVNRQFTIQFHMETGIDEDGNEYQYRVVDNVSSQALPIDESQNNLLQLPGMGGTADQAADYVNDNITNLATAKETIANQAKAILYLQQQINELRTIK